MSAHGDPDSPSRLLSGKVSFPPPQRLQRVPVSHTHWQNLPALWTLFSHGGDGLAGRLALSAWGVLHSLPFLPLYAVATLSLPCHSFPYLCFSMHVMLFHTYWVLEQDGQGHAQVCPRCTSGVSQLCLRCVPGRSQVSVSLSQVSPRCIPGVPHMSLRCAPGVSQVGPK